MTLQGSVAAANPGLLGFDTDTVVTAAIAEQFKGDGYFFCIRYVSNSDNTEGDLSASEAASILQAGLALMPVQHVRSAGWAPSQSMGQSDGGFAAQYARSIGFPAGINVWCDLEGVASGTSPSVVSSYCNAWYGAVAAAGYAPGLYVGANCGLSGEQLYDLAFQHYWQSASNVPEIPNRGYLLIQSDPDATVNGIGIDEDMTQNDSLGWTCIWLAPQP
jgi:hypothetical protein